MDKKMAFALVLVCIGAFIFFLDICLPEVADDWAYKTEWSNVLSEAYREYFTWNSRLPSCILARVLAIDTLPNYLVCACGAMAFIALVVLVRIHALGRSYRENSGKLTTILMAWIVIVATSTSFGNTFLWHDGQAFYLYPSLYILLFLLPFRFCVDDFANGKLYPTNKPYSLSMCLLLCLIAVLAGWSNENSSAAAIAMASVVCLLTWQRNPNRKLFIAMCVLGTAAWLAMVLAPGPRLRLHGEMSAPGWHEPSFMEKTLFFLKFHIRVIPLYCITALTIFSLGRRKLWTRQETLVFVLYLGGGLLCEVAFYATKILPSPRAFEFAFILISIGCLRVLSLGYRHCAYKRAWTTIVVAISLLPLVFVPKFIKIYRWTSMVNSQLEAARGQDMDVVVPNWPFVPDRLFQSIGSFVSTYDRNYWMNRAVQEVLGVRSIIQANLRCSYKASLNGAEVYAESYDISGNRTHTEFSFKPACMQGAKWLHVAYPNNLRGSLSPRKMWRYLIVRSDNQLSYDDLTADGYLIASLPVVHDGKTVWHRDGNYSMQPEAPVLWFALSDSPTPQGCTYLRAEPTRPDFNETPVWKDLGIDSTTR